MMSDEYYLDPPRLLEESRQELGIPEGSIFTKHLGETFIIPSVHSKESHSWVQLE